MAWKAPALNTVMLRYSREEVTYILNYGRAYSPMPAWGGPGGGPLTEQQIAEPGRLPPVDHHLAPPSPRPRPRPPCAPHSASSRSPSPSTTPRSRPARPCSTSASDTGFAAGAYACGRCHTRGWCISQDPANIAPPGADISEYVDYPDGAGGYGPRLRGGIIPRQFADVAALAEFLHGGAERGVAYGNNGLSGDGMMPGFGDNPNTEEVDGDGMLTDEMIESIARYVRSLQDAQDES